MERKKTEFLIRLCDVFGVAFGAGMFVCFAAIFCEYDKICAFLLMLCCCFTSPLLFLIEEELKERVKNEEPGISDRRGHRYSA